MLLVGKGAVEIWWKWPRSCGGRGQTLELEARHASGTDANRDPLPPVNHVPGNAGDAGVRDYSYQSRVFVGLVLILIFAEVLGLYGLIVSLILNTKANQKKVCF